MDPARNLLELEVAGGLVRVFGAIDVGEGGLLRCLGCVFGVKVYDVEAPAIFAYLDVHEAHRRKAVKSTTRVKEVRRAVHNWISRGHEQPSIR